MNEKMASLDTLCVHAGMEPDPQTGAVIPPIYLSTTFKQEAPGRHRGYEYIRAGSPTAERLQQAIAQLEGGAYGLVFSSGMAAIDAVMHLLKPGESVLSVEGVYGGTYRLLKQVYEPLGIGCRFEQFVDGDSLEPLLDENVRMVWIETPTNPLLTVVDIESVARVCQAYNILLCVDNTFATPILQQPLALGADIVVHSATKYLGGHSDVLLGAVVCNRGDIADRLAFIQKSCGAVPSPFDCFLVLRGIRTLHLRMERHSANALTVAQWLSRHPAVARVYYPGLPEHPQHSVAATQMRYYGGMVSFEVKEEFRDGLDEFFCSLKVFTLAESLGGVESLVCHPYTMTHSSMPEAERKKQGITPYLIRLSVGVEDVRDLLADLEEALDRLVSVSGR